MLHGWCNSSSNLMAPAYTRSLRLRSRWHKAIERPRCRDEPPSNPRHGDIHDRARKQQQHELNHAAALHAHSLRAHRQFRALSPVLPTLDHVHPHLNDVLPRLDRVPPAPNRFSRDSIDTHPNPKSKLPDTNTHVPDKTREDLTQRKVLWCRGNFRRSWRLLVRD